MAITISNIMSEGPAQPTVGQMVSENPSRSSVFEQFGIDYCCCGKKTLAAACVEAGLDIETVHIALAANDRDADGTETNWSEAGLGELADHIEQTYHARLRETLPRLTALTEKVANAHGDRHPELLRVRDVFHDFRPEMEAHRAKEEQVLFSLCRELDAADAGTGFGRDSVAVLVQEMEADHDGAGDALLEIRTLTKDYELPQGGCNAYRAML